VLSSSTAYTSGHAQTCPPQMSLSILVWIRAPIAHMVPCARPSSHPKRLRDRFIRFVRCAQQTRRPRYICSIMPHYCLALRCGLTTEHDRQVLQVLRSTTSTTDWTNSCHFKRKTGSVVTNKRSEHEFIGITEQTRRQAKPDCSPPGYPPRRLLIISQQSSTPIGLPIVKIGRRSVAYRPMLR